MRETRTTNEAPVTTDEVEERRERIEERRERIKWPKTIERKQMQVFDEEADSVVDVKLAGSI